MDIRQLNTVFPPKPSEVGASGAKPAATTLPAAEVTPTHVPTSRAAQLPLSQDEVTPGESLQSLVALKSVGQDGIDETLRLDLQQRVTALALNDVSPEAQERFVAGLAAKFKHPDDDAKLVLLAHALWPTLRRCEQDTSILNDYFAGHGVRLTPTSQVEGGTSLQVDRHAFRESLRAMAKRGPVAWKEMRGLILTLRNVADAEDLSFCRNEVAKLEQKGQLRFVNSEARAQVFGYFDGRLGAQLGREEWSQRLGQLKASAFAAPNVTALANEIRNSTGNDDAAFFAERALHRLLSKALKQATPTTKPAIEAAAAELKAAFAERLDGKLDRYTLEQHAWTQFRKGKIDRRQYLMTSAAIHTSDTASQVTMACVSAQMALGTARHQSQVADIWRDILENLRNAGSDDLRDSEGRIIESASERQLKLMLRERLAKMLTIEPKRLTALSQRAASLSHRLMAMTALYGETNPARRASLQNDIARAEVELGQTRGAVQPRH